MQKKHGANLSNAVGRRPPKPLRHVALVVEASVSPRRAMLAGVARYMQEHEPWSIYLKPLGIEKMVQSWLSTWSGDGVIAALMEPSSHLILKRRVPIVDVAGLNRYPGVPLVRTNDFSVGQVGAQYLFDRGFRNLAFCKYADAFWSEARARGFLEFVRSRGLKDHIHSIPLPGPSRSGPEIWEQQQQQLTLWLRSLPRPVGIMATNDMMGQHVLEACQRAELIVPEELAVVGADDDEPICRISTPPLSSVVIDDELRGYTAAAVLDQMMNGAAPPAEPIYIEPRGVRSRQSTDVFAIDDAEVVRAMRLLRENVENGISIAEVVYEVGISRSVLERRFTRIVGRSINEEIIRLRLNKAIELLSETDLKLEAVARRSGFNSHSYMSTLFLKRLGKSPTEFRRRNSL